MWPRNSSWWHGSYWSPLRQTLWCFIFCEIVFKTFVPFDSLACSLISGVFWDTRGRGPFPWADTVHIFSGVWLSLHCAGEWILEVNILLFIHVFLCSLFFFSLYKKTMYYEVIEHLTLTGSQSILHLNLHQTGYFTWSQWQGHSLSPVANHSSSPVCYSVRHPHPRGSDYSSRDSCPTDGPVSQTSILIHGPLLLLCWAVPVTVVTYCLGVMWGSPSCWFYREHGYS